MTSNLKNNSNNNSPSNNSKVEEQENINEQSNSFSFINRLSMSPETTRILSLDPFSRDGGNLNNNDIDELELGGYRAEKNEEAKTDSPDFNRIQTNKRDFSNINDRGIRADKISAAKTPPNVKALSTADIKRFTEPGVLDQTEYELFDSELSQFSIIKESHNDDSGPTYQFQPGAKRVKTQSDLGDSSMFQIPEVVNEKDISINQSISISEIDINPNSQKDQDRIKSSKINYGESKLLSENISFSFQANDISKIQHLNQTQDYQGENSALDNLDTSSSLAGLTQTNVQNLSNFGENSIEKNLREAHQNNDVGFNELQNTSVQYKQEADESNLIQDVEILRSKDSPQNESPDSYKDDDTYKNLRRPLDHINSDEFDRRESVPMDFTVNSIYLPVASKRASFESRNSIPIDSNPFSSFSLHPNNQTHDPFQSAQSHMVHDNDESVQESSDNIAQSENTQQNIESSNFNQSQHFNITIPELSGKDTQDSISNIETHNIDSYPLDTGSQKTNPSQASTQYSDHQENISVAPSLPSHYDSQLPSRMSFGMVSFGINISMADHLNSRGVSRLGFGFGPDTQNSGFQNNENPQNDEQSNSIHINQELITEIDASKNPILQTNHDIENESRSPNVKLAADGVQEVGGSADKSNLSSRSVHLNSSRNSTPNSKGLLSAKSTPIQIKNENNLSQIKSPIKLSSPNIKLAQSENLSFSMAKSPKSSLESINVKEKSADELNSASRSIHTPSPKKLNPQSENQHSKRSNSTNRTPEKSLNQALSSSRSGSAFKSKTDSPLKKLGISFDGLPSDKMTSTTANSGYSPSRHGVSNVQNSASKSSSGNTPNPQVIKSENSPYSKHTPSKQSEGRSVNKTLSPQIFVSASKSYNFESPSRSRIYNRDSHPNITTPSVSNFIFPGNDAILPNEIIVSSNHNDKGAPDNKVPENTLISPKKSTPLKPRYEDTSNANLDDDLFPDTSIASVLQYTSQHQLNESQVDNFLAESGDSNADLEQFLNRDHMPKLTLEQFYEAVGLDISRSATFEESSEISQDELNLEESDDQSEDSTMLVQYIISSLKNQQKQFYENMCQVVKSEVDQASSHCRIFENIVKSTGSLVIENYINMLEKDRPEFEKSIRANFDNLKNSQLEEFLNKMEDGLNQYESKLLDLIPVLDKNIKNIKDYSFVVTQIKEKLESHLDELAKQLKAEERENVGVESYRLQIADAKSAIECATLEDSELSTKNSELSGKIDELKSKLLELEKEEKTLQSQVSRLSPDTHLFSKREYSRLNAKYKELISETSIEPKSISENGLLFILDDQVEIFLSNPKQGGLDYKSLNLKLVEFYTEEQKQILNSFISRLEAYIKAHKSNLKLRGLLKFISKAWHQFHLILEKLAHPKLESIAKLEVYPLEYYSTASSTPIFFLQITLTVHNDTGAETRNEIVVTNKFTIDDMLKFPNCLGTAKAEKTSGNVKDYEMVKIKNNLKFYKKFDPISIMYDAQAAVNLIDLPKDKTQAKSPLKRAAFRYSFINPTKSEFDESRVDLDKFKNIKSIPNAREKLEKLPELGPDEAPTFLHTFKAYLIRKGLFEEFMGSNNI